MDKPIGTQTFGDLLNALQQSQFSKPCTRVDAVFDYHNEYSIKDAIESGVQENPEKLGRRSVAGRTVKLHPQWARRSVAGRTVKLHLQWTWRSVAGRTVKLHPQWTWRSVAGRTVKLHPQWTPSLP